MIDRPTVFVLGAGASAPYGFPLGRPLLEKVARRFTKGSNEFTQALEQVGFEFDWMHRFGKELLTCGRSSIDAFLETRREYLDVGKAAIAAELMMREKDAALEAAQTGGWYHYLFDRMLAASPTEFLRNRLSVITFNFDRSFERALFRSLKVNYNLPDDECAALASQIDVNHVHGQLGQPAWLPGDGRRRPYTSPDVMGGEVDWIKPCADEIRIIHEEISTRALGRAHAKLAEAEVICFLGFGYHRTNLSRLQVETLNGSKLIFGTCYQMAPGEQRAMSTVPAIKRRPSGEDTLGFLQNTEVIHA